jgi:protease IV
MEPHSPQETTGAHPGHNVRQFVFAAMVLVPALLFWGLFAIVGIGVYGLVVTLGSEEQCAVARIPVQGVLTTTSGGFEGLEYGTAADQVVASIADADADEAIQAILIDVDSPGGTPVAGDEIAQALHEAQKPTVAVVRDMGTSAAYWASVGADYIIASPVSDVGSIGVTMSYTELAGANDEEGSRWIGIASGEHKDAGNPERTLTEDEQAYFQAQVDAVHEYMVDRIATFRPTLSRGEYADLADGRAYLGSEALKHKLIDGVGGIAEARAYLAQVLGVSEDHITVCGSEGDLWSGLL